MPIYAYRCEACGHAQDVLQKISDPLLTVCPACGESSYKKQLTAAGFQLKGSGWYVTDFRNKEGGKAAPAAKGDAPAAGAAAAAPEGGKGSGGGGGSDSSSGGGGASGGSDGAKGGSGSTPPVAAAGSAASGGAACGGSCACH
jgi:putative FmdB family regulatory protein